MWGAPLVQKVSVLTYLYLLSVRTKQVKTFACYNYIALRGQQIRNKVQLLAVQQLLCDFTDMCLRIVTGDRDIFYFCIIYNQCAFKYNHKLRRSRATSLP